MQDNVGFEHSFAGFTDFSQCYPIPSAGWIFAGSSIVLGAAISTIPQIVRIIRRCSSFGLNWMYVSITSFGQFILVYNVIGLHAADFAGVLQVSLAIAIPRFLTFLITFCLWFCYLPIPFLNFIFLDLKRQERSRVLSAWLLGFIIGSGVFLSALHSILVHLFGLAGSPALNFGKALGTFSAILVIFQYVPQMITTWKLQSPGSLSIALLAIQAPGGTVNALFMWIGQGDSWTTWSSILAASLQMWIVLGICIYFKVKRKREAERPSESSSMGELLVPQDAQGVIPGGFDNLNLPQDSPLDVVGSEADGAMPVRFDERENPGEIRGDGAGASREPMGLFVD
jgi:uncharacterized protein with PQ loop repeat